MREIIEEFSPAAPVAHARWQCTRRPRKNHVKYVIYSDLSRTVGVKTCVSSLRMVYMATLNALPFLLVIKDLLQAWTYRMRFVSMIAYIFKKIYHLHGLVWSLWEVAEALLRLDWKNNLRLLIVVKIRNILFDFVPQITWRVAFIAFFFRNSTGVIISPSWYRFCRSSETHLTFWKLVKSYFPAFRKLLEIQWAFHPHAR